MELTDRQLARSPDGGEELRERHAALPGVFLSEMLPNLARIADRFTLLRSLSHRDTVHVTAAHTMLTTTKATLM